MLQYSACWRERLVRRHDPQTRGRQQVAQPQEQPVEYHDRHGIVAPSGETFSDLGNGSVMFVDQADVAQEPTSAFQRPDESGIVDQREASGRDAGFQLVHDGGRGSSKHRPEEQQDATRASVAWRPAWCQEVSDGVDGEGCARVALDQLGQVSNPALEITGVQSLGGGPMCLASAGDAHAGRAWRMARAALDASSQVVCRNGIRWGSCHGEVEQVHAPARGVTFGAGEGETRTGAEAEPAVSAFPELILDGLVGLDRQVKDFDSSRKSSAIRASLVRHSSPTVAAAASSSKCAR